VRVFGLTGGIASGKSTVARRFREWGLPVVDADVIAREIVQKGSPALEELARTFGDDVLDAGGELDRKALADKAFASPEGRRALGAITHPRIAARSQERFAELAAHGEPLAAYEAALLVESGLAGAFRPLVVVIAPADVQLARALGRGDAGADDVRARIAAQMPQAEKAAAADFVIDNAGSLESLDRRAAAVLRQIAAGAGVDVARYRIPSR
jgi:dephospho-CoA kinase